MLEHLIGDAWSDALRDFQHSAWRWEAQGVYREPEEQEALRQFLAGDEPDLSFMRGWWATVETNVKAGKRYGRIRVLTEPLTDYLRFELSFTQHNIDAGEDIRVMTLDRARELDLPEQDFWLLDDELAAVMHFDENGFRYADAVTSPQDVERFREIRDRAWKDAVPFREYFASR
ncbi:DUF6879 family protein [Lentzea albidocapillata]|uniref:DUF6879 domain-containing protein n=1 Tax=Lentzea albidocapillata TaxID=40571 RepID=A0A1W2FQH2_9PSEU|nr:DUF6879 family protein [Lentzea albidocapillata]SMD24219.1 hypothetical protein SAMN05660733_07679 [Lentzea albidocapillata]